MLTEVVQIIFFIVLFLLSFGIGLYLHIDDFRRAIQNPLNVTLGFIVRGLILPVLAFLIAQYFGMSQEMTIGLVLVVSCSGGVTSNFFTALAKGDVALSVSLTALSSISTILTTPIILSILFNFYSINPIEAQLNMLDIILKLFLLILLPTAIGMFLKSYLSNQITKRLYTIISGVSLVTLGAAIISQVFKYREFMVERFSAIGFPVLLLQISSILTMFFLSTLITRDRKSSIAIGLECSIQNCIQVLAVISLLGGIASEEPALYYGVLMYLTEFLFVYLFRNELIGGFFFPQRA